MNDEIELLEESEHVQEIEEVPCEIPRIPVRHVGFSMPLRFALALILSVVTVFCKVSAPESATRLQRWIVGDGSERVQQAFFRMEEALGEGETVGEAWTAFCQELTDETA